MNILVNYFHQFKENVFVKLVIYIVYVNLFLVSLSTKHTYFCYLTPFVDDIA